MTKFEASSNTGGLIEHQRIYEHGKLISYRVRYFWNWYVTKFPKQSKRRNDNEG